MTAQPCDSAAARLAAVFNAPGELELRKIPLPAVQAGEALVRVTCCTICGSDLHTYSGDRKEATPSILGHEIVGVVEAVGDPPLRDLNGNALQPNDRVTWATSIGCGRCDRCESDMPQKCRNLAKYGHERAVGREALSGGLAEFVLLRPTTSVVTLDAAIADAVMCPANCATATVVAACRTAGRIADKRVLIFGAGMLGLTAAAFTRSQGAARVVVCDHNATRLERAMSFGADGTALWHDDLEELQSRLRNDGASPLFDVILEVSGASAAVTAGCELADVAAQIVLVGTVMPCESVALDPEQIVRRWLSIRGVHNYTPSDLQAAVGFLQQFHDTYPFAQLVERSYPLTRVDEAIEYALHERPVRVAILPQMS